MNSEAKSNISLTLSYIFLTFIAIICIVPFFMMLVNATHSNAELVAGVNLLPGGSLIKNYFSMLEIINPWKMLLNSILITVPSTVLMAYVGALTAYGFSKYRFKGNTVTFWIVLTTMMIPSQMTIIGLFQLSKAIGVIDTYIPIIIPAIANASTVFWLKGYFDAVLDEALLEAARMEGMGELKIFHRIGLPIARTGIATISIFNFVSMWNNYITPLSMLSTKDKFPLSIGIAIIRWFQPVNLGSVYISLVVSVIPILIIYIVCSRFILGDISSGALKG
jgi:multiple sugar transport system permease protein